MTDQSLWTRRRMLRVTSSAAAVGLAGCSGAGGGSGATATEDHTEDASHSTTESGSGHHGEETEHHGEETEHHEEETGHSGDSHNHETGVGEPTKSATVEMLTQDGSYHFAPHVVWVTVGGTVTWTNESGSHSTIAYHPDNDQPQLVPDGTAAWDSGLLTEQGATFEHTFETEGVYHYYCGPHESLGMIGSVIVGEPDPHEQPALQEPPADKPEAVREKLSELNAMVNEALGHTH